MNIFIRGTFDEVIQRLKELVSQENKGGVITNGK